MSETNKDNLEQYFNAADFFSEFNLSEMQILFIIEYYKPENKNNKTKAAVNAGYAVTSARRQGVRLFRKDNVCAAMEKYRNYLKERVEDKFKVTNDRILLEYARLAFLNPQHFYDENGNLLSIPDMPEDVARALTGVDVQAKILMGNDDQLLEQRTSKIKFQDKKGALDSLARIKNMFEEDNKGKGGDTKILMAVFPSDKPLTMAEWEAQVIEAKQKNAGLLEYDENIETNGDD